MKRNRIIISVLIAASFIIGLYLYPQMPTNIASHWNARGEVDGYLPKFWGLFLMPMISLAILLLLAVVPKIDPLKENIEKFRKYFDGFILVLIIFLFYIYLLSIAWNLEYRFDFTRYVIPAMGLFFYSLGILLAKAKRNWFIGIRTPWTLSSDEVWDKVHQLGGKLFKANGILALTGLLFPPYVIYFTLLPAIFVTLFLVIYSYFEFKKNK